MYLNKKGSESDPCFSLFKFANTYHTWVSVSLLSLIYTAVAFLSCDYFQKSLLPLIIRANGALMFVLGGRGIERNFGTIEHALNGVKLLVTRVLFIGNLGVMTFIHVSIFVFVSNFLLFLCSVSNFYFILFLTGKVERKKAYFDGFTYTDSPGNVQIRVFKSCRHC